MKKFFFTITFFVTLIAVKAQTPPNAAADTLITDLKKDPSVTAPVFPGGNDGWITFLRRTVRYPVIARENNIQGQVAVQFIVEADGSLSSFNVLSTPSGDLSKESLRVLSLSPKWKPATKNGRPVRVLFVTPINYTLSQGNNVQQRH